MPPRLPIGTELDPAGRGVQVRVWAPTHAEVAFVVEEPARREVVLARQDAGYHAGFVEGVAAGARYRFRLGGDPQLHADPASRFQPAGAFGPSQVIDPAAFAWAAHEASWRGIPRHRHVIYELHVGTFTPEGTWAAALTSLPYLAELGITTIEMMPIAEFAGAHNWGYDGVHLFAPSHRYGAPDDLRRFVERAHALGLAVILDVVYNHFGPAGNPLFAWSPYYRGARHTEWGDGIWFDGPHSAAVRELFVANAGYWIDEYHFDGLRLDATQAIVDDSPAQGGEHVLAEIARRARAAGRGRHVFLVGENEPQRVELLAPPFELDALWNDDYHHAAHVALTGVANGYLAEYEGTPEELVAAVRHGFLYQGQLYPWHHDPRGSSTRGLARDRFVVFLENHDQVANLGFGERLVQRTDPASLRALTALTLLTPALPLIFQGQEHASSRPWQFFVDHDDPLREAVRSGRMGFLAQFAHLGTPEAQAALAVLADPGDEATFLACVLDPAARTLDHPVTRLYRDLLRLRRDDPAFTDARPGALDAAVIAERAFVVRYFQDDPAGDRLLIINLGRTLERRALAEPLIAPPAGTGWTTLWSSEHPQYGGHGTPRVFDRARIAIPGRAAVALAPDPGASLLHAGT